MNPISPATAETPSPRLAELATGVLRDAKEVMRAEFALAKDELRAEMRKLSRVIIASGLTILLLNTALLALSAGAILWFEDRAQAALAVGGVLVLLAVLIASAVLVGVRKTAHHGSDQVARGQS